MKTSTKTQLAELQARGHKNSKAFLKHMKCGFKEGAAGQVSTRVQAYTELTIPAPGWYFFYPSNPRLYERSRYIELFQDTIDDGDLHCKAFAGTYIGPITPPERQEPTP